MSTLFLESKMLTCFSLFMQYSYSYVVVPFSLLQGRTALAKKKSLIYKSINQSINQSIRRAGRRAGDRPTDRPTNQPINQPTNQSINQSISQSIN